MTAWQNNLATNRNTVVHFSLILDKTHRNRENVRLMKGFTLIEVMIVVVIIGILAAIAYPSYVNQVQRSHRADAQGEMLAYAQAMERCFTTTNTYAGCENTYNPDIDTARYAISVAERDATSFRIVAQPGTAQTGDRCGQLEVNHRGQTDAAGPADCWN